MKDDRLKGLLDGEAKSVNRTQVKICGITNAQDALLAIECGADALGFNLFPGSKRFIDMAASKDWIGELPRETAKVAVLVNPSLRQAIELTESAFFDALQLHGDESPEFCRSLADRDIRFAKAFAVTDARSLQDFPEFFTRSVLLDSRSVQGFGGSGRTFPWHIAREFVDRRPDLEITLAGGLTPQNVADAIRQVRPFGIDVTSGVEFSLGRKDASRMRAFMTAMRSSLDQK